MMKTTTAPTPDLTDRDKQIAATEHELEAAQNRYRSRPRHGMSLGQGPQQIDPTARAHMLDLGLEVDDAVIKAETLKRQKAEVRLAALTDPAELAAEEFAEQAARAALDEAEAKATEARTVWQHARGLIKNRQERVKTMREEIARAEAAIRSAQSLREKEQTERSALVAV